MMMKPSTPFKLVSKENKQFEVNRGVAMMTSNLVKSTLDTDPSATKVPLPSVSSGPLANVAGFIARYPAREKDSTKWDTDFVAYLPEDVPTLYDLLTTANYMDMPILLDLVARKLGLLVQASASVSPVEFGTQFLARGTPLPEKELASVGSDSGRILALVSGLPAPLVRLIIAKSEIPYKIFAHDALSQKGKPYMIVLDRDKNSVYAGVASAETLGIKDVKTPLVPIVELQGKDITSVRIETVSYQIRKPDEQTWNGLWGQFMYQAFITRDGGLYINESLPSTQDPALTEFTNGLHKMDVGPLRIRDVWMIHLIESKLGPIPRAWVILDHDGRVLIAQNEGPRILTDQLAVLLDGVTVNGVRRRIIRMEIMRVPPADLLLIDETGDLHMYEYDVRRFGSYSESATSHIKLISDKHLSKMKDVTSSTYERLVSAITPTGDLYVNSTKRILPERFQRRNVVYADEKIKIEKMILKKFAECSLSKEGDVYQMEDLHVDPIKLIPLSGNHKIIDIAGMEGIYLSIDRDGNLTVETNAHRFPTLGLPLPKGVTPEDVAKGKASGMSSMTYSLSTLLGETQSGGAGRDYYRKYMKYKAKYLALRAGLR